MTNRATTGENEGRLKGMLTHKGTDYLGLPVGGQYLDKGSKRNRELLAKPSKPLPVIKGEAAKRITQKLNKRGG
jgi:hypothetical protein